MANYYSQQHPYGYAQYTQPAYTPEFHAGQISPNQQIPFPGSGGGLATPAHRPKHFSRHTNTVNEHVPYKSALKNGQTTAAFRTENGVPVNVQVPRRSSKTQRGREDPEGRRGRISGEAPHALRPMNSSGSSRRGERSVSRQRTNSKTRFIPGTLNHGIRINVYTAYILTRRPRICLLQEC
jgi:hypothetical protein